MTTVMRFAAAQLQAAIIRRPLVVTPTTSIREAIAHITQFSDNAAALLSEESEGLMHREVRSRYLVVVEAESPIAVLTLQDLLQCTLSTQDIDDQTVAQLSVAPLITVSEAALPDRHSLERLFHQQQLRPVILVNELAQLTGLLAYESYASLFLEQPSAHTETVAPGAERSPAFSDAQLANRVAHIHASLDVQTTLETLATELRAVLGCDRVLIYPALSAENSTIIAESRPESMRSVLHQNVPALYLELDWLNAYRQDGLWIVDDVQTLAPMLERPLTFLEFAIQAQIIAPVILDETVWGFILICEQETSRQWQLEAIALVQQLVEQGAIALQQAQDHERTQAELQTQQKVEQQLQQVLEVTANKMGSEFFATSALQLGEALGVAHVILTERNGPMLRTLAFAMDNVLQPIMEYPIKDTPCEKVMATGEFFCECFVQKHFPKDEDLIHLGAESYLGFSMYGAQGETVGHLCILDREPILRSEWAVKLMRAFAARASAELERQQAIDALQTLNQELEGKVAERTADLQQSYRQLQEAQVQLVQSEKMSSLGQLVAGVAHEINNPVSFIYGNLEPCLEYVDDLSHLIELYQAHYPQPTSPIEAFIEEADIPYILEDFPQLINSMQTGATRIQTIVQSLRTFSHAQQEGCKVTDLHDNLDNTLVILQNRLNGRSGEPAIEVVKDYGDLPLVKCFSGLLNQVFMNLLVNAIDAIEHRQDGSDGDYQGCLTITTRVVAEDKVTIAVRDNGMGMTAETQEKIFNPFFTTKPVGVGTGMGLSISYKIVTSDHGGQFNCHSVMGEGTELQIALPIQPKT